MSQYFKIKTKATIRLLYCLVNNLLMLEVFAILLEDVQFILYIVFVYLTCFK